LAATAVPLTTSTHARARAFREPARDNRRKTRFYPSLSRAVPENGEDERGAVIGTLQ